MTEIRIKAKHPAIDITVPLGAGVAAPSGFGGWEEVPRLEDVAATQWKGQAPLRQDVPIMLNGWGARNSVQPLLNEILKLGRDVRGNEHAPPVFQLISDAIHFSGMYWVLPSDGIELSTDEDDVIRGRDGTLYRQALTLHCLEFVRPDEIRLRGKKKHTTRFGLDRTADPVEHKVTAGARTLEKIAALVFGNWKRWKEIGDLNGISDPTRVLPIGRVLRLP